MVPYKYLNMRYYMLLNFLPAKSDTEQFYLATACLSFYIVRSIRRDKASEVYSTVKKKKTQHKTPHHSLKPIKRWTQSWLFLINLSHECDKHV